MQLEFIIKICILIFHTVYSLYFEKQMENNLNSQKLKGYAK